MDSRKRLRGDESHDRPSLHHKKYKSAGRDSNRHGGSLLPHSGTPLPFQEAVEKLPPSRGTLGCVSPHMPYQVPPGLPPLPEIDDSLSTAPFTHKSSIHTYDRTVTSSVSGKYQDVTYERLEFLGDAYIEIFASRLIWDRFYHLSTAGQMSQIREALVKNETLSEYSRAYGFDKRVKVGDWDSMQASSKGNKGFNKVLGDVFEAYMAAVVLSDPEHGFAVAEKWMFGLWAPKLYEMAQKGEYRTSSFDLTHIAGADPSKTYDPSAKVTLQQRIVLNESVKLEYEPYMDSVELKGEMLGLNKHFIAVYLTGYGYEKVQLGKGEGKNKVEAGNWAATDAMHGEHKAIVDKCADQCRKIKEKKRLEKEAKMEKELTGTGAEPREKITKKEVLKDGMGKKVSREEEKAAFANLILQTAAKQGNGP